MTFDFHIAYDRIHSSADEAAPGFRCRNCGC